MGSEHCLSPSWLGRAVWLGTHLKSLGNMLQLVGHIHDAKRVNMKRCCHARPERTDPVAHAAQGTASLKTAPSCLWSGLISSAPHSGHVQSLWEHIYYLWYLSSSISTWLGKVLPWATIAQYNTLLWQSRPWWDFSTVPCCCMLLSLQELCSLAPARYCTAGMTKQELCRQMHFMRSNYRAEQNCVRETEKTPVGKVCYNCCP